MVDICNNAKATGFTGEFDSGFDFGEHGARFEIAFLNKLRKFFGGDFVNRLSVWGTVINIGVRDGSDGNKYVGFDFFSEAFGGKIFVDNGIDTPKAFQDFGAVNWNTTTAGRNYDDAVFDEFADSTFFDNVNRLGASNDATPTATRIFFNGPVVDFGESLSLFFAIELTDWLGGIIKSRVIDVDYDLRNNSCYFTASVFQSKGIMNGLSQPITDLTLTHSNSSFEWHGRSFFGGTLFFVNEDIADLGTVTMSDHDFVFTG